MLVDQRHATYDMGVIDMMNVCVWGFEGQGMKFQKEGKTFYLQTVLSSEHMQLG